MISLEVLGPLQASRDGDALPLGGPKQRMVLGVLAASGGRRVPTDGLLDAVWGDAATDGLRASLQAYVSRLRRVLGSDVIRSRDDGYQLDLPRDAVDAWRFEDAIERAGKAAPSDPGGARELLEEALSWWRGEAYAQLGEVELLAVESRRLEELRLGALEDRIDAELLSGPSTELVAELAVLTREHPLRERLRGQHMRALYAAGRQADALEVYERTRRDLVEELGIEPSPELRELQRRMLAQDPTLDRHQPVVLDEDLPSGTVTFVFTDIEGSTRLLHDLGDDYAEVLHRHRELLREAWSAEGGFEIGTEGDGSFVVFASAAGALRACAAARAALGAQAWPGGRRLWVRMGVHTGLASPRGGGYVALAVHEAARVSAAANGGQILVSAATVARLDEEDGRDEVPLWPLGRYRLRGFDDPVALYAVDGAGARPDPPPVRATPADGHNLVRPGTATLGREELVETVTADLVPGRLLTLLGPGGVGKTRVAIEVGMDLSRRWDGGAWLVELAPVASEELVAAAIADAVGAPSSGPTGDRWEDVVRFLGDRPSVVILDNCEHLIDACRDAAEALRQRCPEVAVLATSRTPLHARGERLRPVEPLDWDPGDAEDPPAAVRLFLERARAVRPELASDDDTLGTIAAICRQLDGLPLLIELAAALCSVQTPAEILDSLAEDPERLRSRDPRTPARHGSVQGLIGWSYRLLDADQQAAFRRLAVFGSSFTLETAAVAVAAPHPPDRPVPDLVWSLVDRSLVVADLRANGTRYRMLETVRGHARRLLDDEGERSRVAVALGRHLLRRLGPEASPDRAWVDATAEELDNLRALVPLVVAAEPAMAQRLGYTVGRYHDHAHRFSEGVRELAAYVALLPDPSPERVGLLCLQADLHLRGDRVDEARRLVEEAARLAADHGPPPWDDTALDRTQGEIALRSGQLERAIEIAEAALARELSERGAARMANLLGIARAAAGDFEAAYASFTEELAHNRALRDDDRVASAEGNLAEAALRLGDPVRAAEHQRACLDLALRQGSTAYVAYSLIVAARLASEEHHDPATAVRLQGRADRLLADIGLSLYPDDREACDLMVASAESELGAEQVADRLREGQALSTAAAATVADDVLATVAGTDGEG